MPDRCPAGGHERLRRSLGVARWDGEVAIVESDRYTVCLDVRQCWPSPKVATRIATVSANPPTERTGVTRVAHDRRNHE